MKTTGAKAGVKVVFAGPYIVARQRLTIALSVHVSALSDDPISSTLGPSWLQSGGGNRHPAWSVNSTPPPVTMYQKNKAL